VTIPPDVVAQYEALRREELFAVARQMTDLGLSGEDPDDPRIASLLAQGLEATTTQAELRAWLKVNFRR